MAEIITKKPPCKWCDEGIPHGGGEINTTIFAPWLGLIIRMPFCNYSAGRTAQEIAASIFETNPQLYSLTPGVCLHGRVIEYLDLGNFTNPS